MNPQIHCLACHKVSPLRDWKRLVHVDVFLCPHCEKGQEGYVSLLSVVNAPKDAKEIWSDE